MDTQRVTDLIISTLRNHLADPGKLDRARGAAQKSLPKRQIQNIEAVLATKRISYRDALIIQVAYGLCSDTWLDLTQRQPGSRGLRGVAGRLGAFLGESHIVSVQDAIQNIGKNTPNLVRGNFPEFDEFLRWAAERARSRDELRVALDYACAAVASTARPVRPMPSLSLGELTFGRVLGLVEQLFSAGSQGAYEQFTTAALLHALLEQTGAQGHRVETKSLNATDRSSRVAGDIQILTGTRVVEAYEVTANEWRTKVGGAERTIKEHDLSRLHVVAVAPGEGRAEMLRTLQGLPADVSVLDLHALAACVLSALTRKHRAIALERLYEFLDRYQPNIEKVNRYVDMLEELHLTQGN